MIDVYYLTLGFQKKSEIASEYIWIQISALNSKEVPYAIISEYRTKTQLFLQLQPDTFGIPGINLSMKENTQ